MSTEKSPDTDPKELPLVSHLVELRDRLLRCVICVLVVFLALTALGREKEARLFRVHEVGPNVQALAMTEAVRAMAPRAATGPGVG